MLRFLVLFAIVECIFWLFVQHLYIGERIRDPRRRVAVAFLVSIWAFALPWIVGVWLLLFETEMRILGLALLIVWYIRYFGVRWTHQRSRLFLEDQRILVRIIIFADTLLTLYVLYNIYRVLG